MPEANTSQANLLDLDKSFGRRLLAGAALTGESERHWAAAAADLATRWEIFPCTQPPVAWCAAYHVNPDELPGLPLLQQLRELQALAAYARSASDPAFRAELTKRITSLRVGTQATPWRAL